MDTPEQATRRGKLDSHAFSGETMVLLTLGIVASAQAADIAHQGRVVDSLGAAVNGEHTLTVALYNVAENGTALNSWTFNNATLSDGYYSVLLDNVAPSDLTGDVWVGVRVLPGVEMTPRTPLAHSPRSILTEGIQRPADGSSAASATTSCAVLHAAYPDLPTASYWVDPDGSGTTWTPSQMGCDMHYRGGGWTLCYEGDAIHGGVTVTGWHTRTNNTARGSGEYARNCKALTPAVSAVQARVVYIDNDHQEGTLSPAPSLNDNTFTQFVRRAGPSAIGIEINKPTNPGVGHCWDNTDEDNSWGKIGLNESCFLDSSATGWYNSLAYVAYWVR